MFLWLNNGDFCIFYLLHMYSNKKLCYGHFLAKNRGERLRFKGPCTYTLPTEFQCQNEGISIKLQFVKKVAGHAI